MLVSTKIKRAVSIILMLIVGYFYFKYVVIKAAIIAWNAFIHPDEYPLSSGVFNFLYVVLFFFLLYSVYALCYISFPKLKVKVTLDGMLTFLMLLFLFVYGYFFISIGSLPWWPFLILVLWSVYRMVREKKYAWVDEIEYTEQALISTPKQSLKQILESKGDSKENINNTAETIKTDEKAVEKRENYDDFTWYL